MTTHPWIRCALCWLGLAVPAAATAAVAVPDGFVNEVVVGGLAQPNSMALLPDGRVLFTEQRTARVRMVVGNHVAASDPVLTVPDVNTLGLERGLLGIAVDPAWPSRPYVYLFLDRVGNTLRVVRYTATGDLTDPAGENLTLDTPLVLLDDLPDVNKNHNAGCLRFGPGGHLFVSLGDDESPCAANDSTSLAGQILRLDVSGLGPAGGGPVARALLTPADNPLSTPDSNARMVYAYGMRNPWRFHIDPSDGQLYVADVGEATFEEYNEVDPGDHLGWPFREGSVVIKRASCAEPAGPGTGAYKSAFLTLPNASPTAISSAGIYRAPGGVFDWPGDYEGNAFFGEYYSGILRRLMRQGGSWVAAAPVAGQPNPDDWATGFTSAVDFAIGPEGDLLWLRQFNETFSGVTGSLQRIRYTAGVVDAGMAAGARPLTASPTPFIARVELGFALARRGAIELSVYDLAGRRVRDLASGWRAAGPQRIEWDGRDGRGRTLAPGIYLARLARPDGVESVRLLKLR